jgi:polysaccharide deacetylase 2 family uncharacterized protein YibQ
MARDRARARGGGLGWFRSLIFSAVFGVLLFVIAQEMRSGHVPILPAVPRVDCSGRLADLTTQINEATALLAQSGLPLLAPIEEKQGAERLRYIHRRYEVSVPPTITADEIRRRLAPLGEHDPCVVVDVTTDAGGAHVQVGIDEVLTHTMLMRWATPTPVRMQIAIVIDDLGNDLLSAREFAGLDAPLAFAIAPFRSFSKEVAEVAHRFNREVLLRLPTDDGGDATDERVLRAVAARAAIEDVLTQALAAVPYVVGTTVAADSPIARDRQRMRWLLSWLNGRQLFLVDYATQSTAAELAAGIGIAVVSSAVMLDDVPAEAAVRDQLAALLQQARERGSAIGVGHPQPMTATALKAVLPEWRAAGVELLPISTLIQAGTLASK